MNSQLISKFSTFSVHIKHNFNCTSKTRYLSECSCQSNLNYPTEKSENRFLYLLFGRQTYFASWQLAFSAQSCAFPTSALDSHFRRRQEAVGCWSFRKYFVIFTNQDKHRVHACFWVVFIHNLEPDVAYRQSWEWSRGLFLFKHELSQSTEQFLLAGILICVFVFSLSLLYGKGVREHEE